MFRLKGKRCQNSAQIADVALAAAASLCLFTSFSSAADVNTSALSQNGWHSDDTRADGTGSQAANTNLISTTLTDAPENAGGNPAHDADILSQIQFGQAPGSVPLGTWTGAVNLSIGNNGSGKSTVSHRKDDGIGHAPASVLNDPAFFANYAWMGDGTLSVSAGLKIGIKTSEFGLAAVSPRTGEGAWDKLLVYEPGNQQPDSSRQSNGTWHHEMVTATNGRWWIVDRIPGGGNNICCPQKLSDMSASSVMVGSRTVSAVWAIITAPGSYITSLQYGIGSGNADGNVYVNELQTSFYRVGDRTTFGPPPPSLSLVHAGSCVQTGNNVIIDIDMVDPGQVVVGGQFFLWYDATKLQFVSADPGDAPFTMEVHESHLPGLLDYAVGVPFGGTGTSADTTMARITFTAIGEVCNVADRVMFRPHTPETRLTVAGGAEILPDLNDLPAITIDGTAPTLTVPPDVTVECDPSDPLGLPGVVLATAVGGVEIEYNIGFPEAPAHQAYLKSQLSHTNTNGMHLTFSSANLPPYNIPGLSWATLFGQVSPSQFGFDMVLPAPTNIGNPLPPFLNAYDNVNNNCANATATPGFIWALNDYNALGGPSVNNCVINSLFRSAGLAPNAVTVTKNILTLSGTVYTVEIGGILETDGFIHWFNPATPNSPVSNFQLTGKFYFSGTLTYDSFGDPGNDGDFYAGTITISANSPYTGANAVGVATVSDNCDPLPVVAFSDVVTPGACPQEKTIARTWTATDACGNMSSGVQTITIADSMPPVITYCPPNITVNADAGSCSAAVSVGVALAQDCCDPNPVVVGTRSDAQALGAPYPAGVTTITWTATDACGNSSFCLQTVTVNAVNELVVTVELLNLDPGLINRCITFEFSGVNNAVFSQVMAFNNGIASDTLEIPCGDYDCVRVRDVLHTLARADSLIISGTQYQASFTGPAGGLLGGNLNDDPFVDILDFGVFVGQWAANYGSGDTSCATPFPHADISGDGLVTGADFTFISGNFLKLSETGCTPFAGGRSIGANNARAEPVTRISVKELRLRGLHDLVKADLNRDGWLDQLDIAAFINGGHH